MDDGDADTITPEDIVGEEADSIVLLGAEVQWRGVERVETSTETSTNTNNDTATATTSAETDTSVNSDTEGQQTSAEEEHYFNNKGPDDILVQGNIPEGQTSLDFLRIEVIYFIQNVTDSEVTTTVEYIDENLEEQEEEVTIPANSEVDFYTGETEVDNTGETVYVLDSSSETEVVMGLTTVRENIVISPGEPEVMYPSPPSGYDFVEHQVEYEGYSSPDAPDDFTTTQNRAGLTESEQASLGDGEVTITITTVGEKEVTNSKTASTTYPSVPTGYNFDRHSHQEFENSNRVVNNTITSNRVGQTESRKSTSTTATVEVELETQGEKEVEEVFDTERPSLSGDVLASGPSNLNDGEVSSYVDLDDAELGDNNVTHSVEGSNKVEYRVKVEWEFDTPEAISTITVRRGLSSFDVALASPQDSALEHNTVRVYTEEHGVLALDVVPTSHDDATSIRIQHPAHGELALRGL